MELSGASLVMLMIVGVVVGIVCGMLGLGGGILVIPAMVFLFGFKHEQAVGTSLGMLLPPIGIFAFLTYYRAGHVNLSAAAMLAGGFAIGALLGSKLVISGHVPERTLQLLLGYFMVYLSATMILRTEKRAWATAVTGVSLALAAIGYAGMRLIGRKLEWRFSSRDRFMTRLEQPIAPDYEI